MKQVRGCDGRDVIKLNLKFSKILATVYIMVNLIAVFAIFIANILLILKIILIIVLFYSVFINLNKYILLSADNSVVSIWQKSEEQWAWQTKNGINHLGTIQSETLVSQFVVIVLLVGRNARTNIIIARDSVGPDNFRQLCSVINRTK